MVIDPVQIVHAALAIHAAAVAVVNLTNTPHPLANKYLSLFYSLTEKAAGIVTPKAKQ